MRKPYCTAIPTLSRICFVLTWILAGYFDVGGHVVAREPDQNSASPTETENAKTLNWRVTAYSTGAPVAGATVEVQRQLTLDQEYLAVRTLSSSKYTTDTEGRFSVTFSPNEFDPEKQSLKIIISHPNFLPRQLRPLLPRHIEKFATENSLKGEMIRLHAAREVRGVLQTPDGKPASQVAIKGICYPGRQEDMDRKGGEWRPSQVTAITDEDGAFKVLVGANQPGKFWFVPEDYASSGFFVSEQTVDVGTLQLEAGVRVKGRVLDPDAKPIGSLKVVARSIDRDPLLGIMRHGERTAITDRDGRFELAPVRAGRHSFDVILLSNEVPPPIHSGVFLPLAQKISTDSEEIELQAVPSVEIRVTTVDSKRVPSTPLNLSATGRSEGLIYSTRSLHPKRGLSVLKFPAGFTKTTVILTSASADEALLLRRSPELPYEANPRGFTFNSLDADVEVEIVHFQPTHVAVKTIDASGKEYPEARPTGTLDTSWIAETMDVEFFQRIESNLWRSQPLIPGGLLTITVDQPGVGRATKQLKIDEGLIHEITLTLMPD
ncbi:MAG: peptidase BlaR1 [Schlesneria sp.]|nr:peptidase BlaR1 [Schlesneria sp.]